jgi:4-hydroxy-4-methyl-2-oxoglutarate aldolase
MAQGGGQAAGNADMSLIARLEGLRAAVVSDCLDRFGVRANAMASRIRPLFPEAKVAGYAVTVQVAVVDQVPSDRDSWYKGELQAVDTLGPGDVMVVSTTPDGPFWGELLATAARYRGARGVVLDAATRDTLQLIEMRFPVFSASINPLDSLGRLDVESTNVPVHSGGVLVNPGDLVLGDHDGVVVIPAEAAEEVIRMAEEKSSGEDLVRQRLEEGMGTWEAFKKYGVI